MKESHYTLLGVQQDASQEEIKLAYRKLIKEYHPDHFGKDSRPFLKIQDAYAVLGDPVKRNEYNEKIAPKRKARPIRDVAIKRPPIEPLDERPGFGSSFDFFDQLFERIWNTFYKKGGPWY